jgi:RecB family exonuclease
MHRAIATRASDGAAARACAIIVPTRGAGVELRRTLENLLLLDPSVLGSDAAAASASKAIIFPELLTRSDFYVRLHERLNDVRPLLTDFEREVILRRAAVIAGERGAPAPFRLRAGLIVEILAFYDELRRCHRTVADFERLIVGSLEPSAAMDRGAERMLRQTRFLAAAFEEFERRVQESGRIDEHGLRAHLVNLTAAPTYSHVIVTIPDQAADTRGLWIADYDLLARMPGLERIDVIATERLLATGFHERIHDLLPGIEEEKYGTASVPPVLMTPASNPDEEPQRWFVCRDREEELVDIVRTIKRRGAGPDALEGQGGVALERIAVVFQRPLPYLYLARQTFAAAALPYQAVDALPLAGEPFAAAIDVLFSFALAEGTRGSLIELLGSPHWRFGTNDETGPQQSAAARRDCQSLDRVLRDLKYTGGWERLRALAEGFASALTESPTRRSSLTTGAAYALQAAAAAADELRQIIDGSSASAQIKALLRFIAAHERRPEPEAPWYARHLRARAAVLGALESLREAHARYDDEPLPFVELAGTIRRWIEGQTFSPRTGSEGVTLADVASAAFADLDEVRLVGLVEPDWPERPRRSIFYPPSLLAQLGWPADPPRLAAARARFQDLLWLPRARIAASAFSLEDDAIVPPSPFLEELRAVGLPVERIAPPDEARVFIHQAISEEPVRAEVLSGDAAEWLALRLSRSSAASDSFHGSAGVREPGVYAVSHVERYLECPFKYFAGHVLRLQEERDEESGLTPQERGQFLHVVFEAFFHEWHRVGRRALTADNLGDALEMFARVAEGQLQTLGESDRALERTHLLGSAVAPGLAERAFAFEIEHGDDVLERLLEHALEGAFTFEGPDGPRHVSLRAKADRIDLLADGTLRVVDYKLGKAPKTSRALQLQVYGVCAQQALEGYRGRSWTLSKAGYVAFREKNSFVALGVGSALEKALAEGQERFLGAVAGIEHGSFPPKPDEPWLCTRCGFSTVCRKDYVGDD